MGTRLRLRARAHCTCKYVWPLVASTERSSKEAADQILRLCASGAWCLPFRVVVVDAVLLSVRWQIRPRMLRLFVLWSRSLRELSLRFCPSCSLSALLLQGRIPLDLVVASGARLRSLTRQPRLLQRLPTSMTHRPLTTITVYRQEKG